MEISLPLWPSTLGAQLAQVAAIITFLMGFVFVVTAKPLGQRWGFAAREGRDGAIGELRVAGGFLMGLGLGTYLFDQPHIYVILGGALGFAAFGRLLSMMSASDRAGGLVNFLLLLVQAALATAALVWLFDVWTEDAMLSMPEDQGTLITFGVSAATAILGAVIMFAPGLVMVASGLAAAEGRMRVIAAVRSAGGFLLGAGIVAMLLSNPLAELALGAAYLFSVGGRILAMVLDRGRRYFNTIALVIQAVFAAILLAHVFGQF